jgi:GNAT superfamily N-acetyltransferase
VNDDATIAPVGTSAVLPRVGLESRLLVPKNLIADMKHGTDSFGVSMTLIFRKALQTDLPAIVRLLTDDELGSEREDRIGDLSPYHNAFLDINADPNQFLCVVEGEGQVVGTLQLTFIPGLSRGGAKRGQIEAVRVARDRRNEGIGRAMFNWAIEQCRAQSCALVQLTTDNARADAHRFYESLGFEASHVGYKLRFGERR